MLGIFGSGEMQSLVLGLAEISDKIYVWYEPRKLRV
jgi:hypothetical protein